MVGRPGKGAPIFSGGIIAVPSNRSRGPFGLHFIRTTSRRKVQPGAFPQPRPPLPLLQLPLAPELGFRATPLRPPAMPRQEEGNLFDADELTPEVPAVELAGELVGRRARDVQAAGERVARRVPREDRDQRHSNSTRVRPSGNWITSAGDSWTLKSSILPSRSSSIASESAEWPGVPARTMRAAVI